MSKQIKNIRGIVRLIGFYIPFTLYFILFAAGCWIAYTSLKQQPVIPDTSYSDIFPLLIRIAVLFASALVALAFITVIISYLFFIIKKNKGIDFRIDTKQSLTKKKERKRKRLFTITEETEKAIIQLHLHPVLKPFLGFIKMRLEYDEGMYSKKFSLVEQSKRKLINTTVDGVYYWSLPEIKEYRVERAIIYFEDFFQFFSFASSVVTNNRFYTQPSDESSKSINVFPRKTEETNTRIEELRRVEGEYINYKNFETNDDVRRIVWKIYAKNKELIVRIPEILDPYASHIYLYPSFFSSFEVESNEVIQVPFLNFYKTIVWNVYKQLVQGGFDVKYITDQQTSQHYVGDDRQQTKCLISTSTWHKEKDLRSFVRPKDASMVLIHSLSNAEQVRELIDDFGKEISFAFVPLTESLRKQSVADWLQWLFVQQEKDDIAMFRTNWSLSLLRPKIIQNEKKLKKILEKSDMKIVG